MGCLGVRSCSRSALVVAVVLGVVFGPQTALQSAESRERATLPSPRARQGVERLIEAQLFAGQNDARARPGTYGHPGPSRAPLAWSEPVAQIARDWADRRAAELVDGHNPHWREQIRLTEDPGVITTGAENMYRWRRILESRSPRQVSDRFVQGWMDSDGHRRNMLGERFDRVGIGVSVASDGTVVAVVNFAGSRNSPMPAPSTRRPRWAAVVEGCAESQAGRFVDVHGPALTAETGCLVELGLVRGVGADRFDPDGQVTRGQAATLIVRTLQHAGVRLPSGGSAQFTDVAAGSVHASAIRALAAAGIISGYPNGTFQAGRPVSRAQIATLQVRAFEYLSGPMVYAPVDYFADDNDSAHEHSIGQVAAAGWDPGSGRVFRPDDPVLRREVVHQLVRWLASADRGTATDLPGDGRGGEQDEMLHPAQG